MTDDLKILLLSDNANAKGVGQDLDILYPGRVEKLDFTKVTHGLNVLKKFSYVITVVNNGTNLTRLDYSAVREYARQGGHVISCLFEYGHYYQFHFSKTHIRGSVLPAMRIKTACDITRGYSPGDLVWWYGRETGCEEQMYDNDTVQRQLMGVKETKDLKVLATSSLNDGVVMLEERIGKGRILALDLLSLHRPFLNSKGSTNKWLFAGNFINQSVHYGKHYPKKLSYDDFVKAMQELAGRYPQLCLKSEGSCSDGRQMWSFNIGNEKNPMMYFGAAIHGWEWEAAFGLLHLAELLCENPHIEGLETGKLHFKIMPVQNPYGYDHFLRQNARGVNLNRNFDLQEKKHVSQAWDPGQDVAMPWDFDYKGESPASEPETRILQGIIERYKPICVIDFHTAEYEMFLPHKKNENKPLREAIHKEIKMRLKNRYICQQQPDEGAQYQQVNMDRVATSLTVSPTFVSYASGKGVPVSFMIELSANRSDVHALVMNTDTVAEICLAAITQCLPKNKKTSVK